MAFRKLAEFREISVEYVSADGTGKLKFFTDMPGNHLVDRSSGGWTLPQTNADHTPTTYTHTLADSAGAPMQGSMYFPRFEPPANGIMQVRGGIVWVRIIPIVLDGTAGEFYETLPITIGV
jgi:hypothetical protein